MKRLWLLVSLLPSLALAQGISPSTGSSAATLTATAGSGSNGLVLNTGAYVCLNGVGCTIRLSYDGSTIKFGDNVNTYFQMSPSTGQSTFNYQITGRSIDLSGTFGSFLALPTVDLTSTPGNVTNNQVSGKSAIAASATSIVVTDSSVAATSRVFIEPLSLDSTCTVHKTVPGAGSFTVTMNAACTAVWSFSFLVIK